jgi:hypothetical protein
MQRTTWMMSFARAGLLSLAAASAAANATNDGTIVVDSANALQAALVPENAGRSIRVSSGKYYISAPLTIPDGVTLVGEGVMLGQRIPSGFKAGTETRIIAMSGFSGDLLSLGDGVTLKRLAIEYPVGSTGNAITAGSRGPGDTIDASIVECEVENGNASATGPQGPLGRTVLLTTRNRNLGAAPLPDEDSRVTVRTTRSIIRSTAGGSAFFAINFASRGRLLLRLDNNSVTGPLEATGGVSRPDAVTGAVVDIQSVLNVYAAPAAAALDSAWRLFGSSGAPIPGIVTGDTNGNALHLTSILDRIEGYGSGIVAVAGRRFAPTNGLSSSNAVDLTLLGLTLRTNGAVVGGADFLLRAAQSLGEYVPGNDNRMRVLVRWSDGSGTRANRYQNSFGAALPENQGVGNRIEFQGSLQAFQRSNQNIDPAPPVEMFQGGR